MGILEKEVNLNLDLLTGEKVEIHELFFTAEGPAILIISMMFHQQ